MRLLYDVLSVFILLEYFIIYLGLGNHFFLFRKYALIFVNRLNLDYWGNYKNYYKYNLAMFKHFEFILKSKKFTKNLKYKEK
jgi:hypothetical protein